MNKVMLEKENGQYSHFDGEFRIVKDIVNEELSLTLTVKGVDPYWLSTLTNLAVSDSSGHSIAHMQFEDGILIGAEYEEELE